MQVDHLPRTSGIYKITCIANGKIYVGSSIDVYKRACRHKVHLQRGTHVSTYMQRAFSKYGEESFQIELLETCDRDNLLTVEQSYLDTLKPKFNTYMTAGSPKGYKHTEETKKRMSERLMGNTLTKGFRPNAETRLKQSLARKGRKASEETKRKMSEALKGNTRGKKPRSDETKARMSEAAKRRWEHKRLEKEKPP